MHPERKEIGHEIRVIQRMLHHKIEAFRAENGDTLTFVQTRTLSFLMKHSDKDMFQKDLEKELNIRRSTATEILNVLERDGYIERQSVSGDKRLKKLVPTQKAIDLGTRAMNHIQLMESTLAQGISAEDLETFYRVTDQIKKNLKGEDQHD